jgi:UDPglucose 6-dehydrogenase
MKETKIGFIGQGWIGKHLADHFAERGFEVVRYAKESPHDQNKEAVAGCHIVFIAVPTPTTPTGFDDSILRGVLGNVGKGNTAVIKSTILPGTTDELQKAHPDIKIFHSPEFLRETSVKHDIAFPDRNIIGVPSDHFNDSEWQQAAEKVMEVLPKAPYNNICKAPEAELTKYAGNNFLYMKVVFMNILYDLAQTYGARWDELAKNLIADPRIGPSHMEPVHQHDHMGEDQGRGAGGHCFIKDFAAFRALYEKMLPHDSEAVAVLKAFEEKNNKLLRDSKKDLDLLSGVYGE